MFQMSDHSELRAAQRRLTEEEVEYVLQFGKRYFCHGAKVFYLRRKDLPASDLRREWWTRLIGTAVVITPDQQTVITVWRNRKSGLKLLRRRAGSRGRAGWGSPWEHNQYTENLAALEESAAMEVTLANFLEYPYLF